MSPRTLSEPPMAVVDPTGTIASGSYRGPLPRVDLSPLGRPRAHRWFRRKKWVYAAVCADDLFAAVAVVDLGYAAKAFAFACKDRVMLADRTALGPPGAASVGASMAAGEDARFSLGAAQVAIVRKADTVDVRARFRGLSLEWELDARAPHPPLSAIGEVPGGGVNTTEKQVLLPARGVVHAEGASHDITRGFGGWDYTHGYLSRHTRWRWAYLMGHADGGAPIAMNLVEGFLGERECALWVDGALCPVGEGRFDFDARDPLAPWRVRTTCGAVDLSFAPWAMHAEDMNFGLIRAHFVQPIGAWTGTVRVGDRAHVVSNVVGVAEDQDVLW